jgi:bifunctional non-homologous end joining protein LigD
MPREEPLAAYNRMRDFQKTREPKGVFKKGEGNSFVVQKHEATRLHYDFRLELDGVLKSWAVTKGPSLDPEDKRLAVRTEDHPMAYGGFEGTIPAGEYGGGTVMLWDQGTWEPVPGKDPRKTLEEGHLHFFLHGKRMKGEWLLVRMKPRGKEKRENWLLRKIEDEYAGGSGDLTDKEVTSVVSGRSMAEIAAGDAVWHSDKEAAKKDPQQESKPAPRGVKRKGKNGNPPPFQPPQLATLVDAVPEGKGWFHEVKYDGYRCLIAAAGGDVHAYTRTGLDWSDKFVRVVEEFQRLDLPSSLIDGEIVALGADGRPSFSKLQDVLKGGAGQLVYFAFDLLELEGKSLTKLTNLERKKQLQALLAAAGKSEAVHYAEHLAQGEKLFEALCKQGYEGIISKRADATYSGKRTRNWLKVKCTERQEFVIIGWTESDKSRGFKSLLLGTRVDGDLHYAGKVGTGFTVDLMNDLMARMRPLERKTAPANVPRVAARKAHWIEPKLVAEVAYAETTGSLDEGGVLRHSSFLGLREDKPAKDVAPEIPHKLAPAAAAVPNISNADRVIFPESGITKGDLAAYYAAMAAPILEYTANRPLSIVRCPQGRAKQCFFQKHDAGTFGDAVHHVGIKEKDGDVADYLYVDSAEGLLACVQMGGIEFHGWGAPAPDIEHPDRMIFDLDPDEGLDFEDVKKAAVILKKELATLGLASDAMLSGGKGIHVVVALEGKTAWEQVKDFASRFARAMAAARPDLFTANIRKVERKSRIFIDWLRNQRGSTAVQPWTVRARENAPVAVPIEWDELADITKAAQFNIFMVDGLAKRAKSKALKNWGKNRQRLPAL